MNTIFVTNETPPNFEWKNLLHLTCINNPSKNQNQNYKKPKQILSSASKFLSFPCFSFLEIQCLLEVLINAYSLLMKTTKELGERGQRTDSSSLILD